MFGKMVYSCLMEAINTKITETSERIKRKLVRDVGEFVEGSLAGVMRSTASTNQIMFLYRVAKRMNANAKTNDTFYSCTLHTVTGSQRRLQNEKL